MHMCLFFSHQKTYILTYCTLCKHAAYEKYGYLKLREKLIFAKLPHFTFIFSTVQSKQTCVWDHRF